MIILAGGFKFTPTKWEDEPILTTVIFFNWVGSTTNQSCEKPVSPQYQLKLRRLGKTLVRHTPGDLCHVYQRFEA